MVDENPRLDTPAVYAIRVVGSLDASWSDRLGGLAITTVGDEKRPVTELCGRLPDRAALLGVLNALYDHRVVLRSVQSLSAGNPIHQS